jgi:hypothetical protein
MNLMLCMAGSEMKMVKVVESRKASFKYMKVCSIGTNYPLLWV